MGLFVVFSLGPLVLAANSFRPFVALSASMHSLFETGFRLTVYYPVTALRTLVVEPLGLGLLYSVPVLQHAVILATLLAFYYGLSVLVVTCGALVSAWLRRDRPPTDGS